MGLAWRRLIRAAMTGPVGPRELARRSRNLRRWIGQQIVEVRSEFNLSQAQLARCVGIDQAHLWRIEAGSVNASLYVLIAIGTCLGCDIGVRLFPTAGPRIHDRFQAPIVEALIRRLGPSWRARPEVPVPAARGVVDLVLARAADGLTIACECHSELRRLEVVLRRAAEKADAPGAQLDVPDTVSTLLILRSTTATRAIATAYEATLAAAYPAAPTMPSRRSRVAQPGRVRRSSGLGSSEDARRSWTVRLAEFVSGSAPIAS